MAALPILGLLGFLYVASSNEEETFVEAPMKELKQASQQLEYNMAEALNGSFYPENSRGQVGTEGNVFHDIQRDRFVGGLPTYLASESQQYVSGIMDNIGPVEKTQVGPGLGVGPNVPAYGGYQQLFRVKPTNVGAYKLTTLPGRSGPAGDVSGGKQPLIGRVNHKIPPKTAHLPTRLPTTMGRGQGQGGAATAMTNHGIFEKSKRTTNRSETGMRTDGLSYGGGQKLVGAATLAQDPTRNKGDFNAFATNHMNNPMPGINNFYGGHHLTPEAMAGELAHGSGGRRILTADELSAYGLRPSENRSKEDRAGNAGRMNVRANPLAQGGALSSVRTDQTRVDGRTGGVNGGYTQRYVQPTFTDLNTYKGNRNPRASTEFLGTAQRQLKNNPLTN